MRVLLVGSGGREHALAWSLAQSPRLAELHAAPGNPGIAELATVHEIAVSDLDGLTRLAASLETDLVVIGPEAPLVAGLADRLEQIGIACFGPSSAAARVEGSKVFAKQVMSAAGVPTAGFALCDTVSAAQAAIAAADGNVVVKADGLAAGKGVFVCSSVQEAEDAVRACLVERRFGNAGSRVLIEERMEGPEVSMLALCDGEHVLPLAPARDYKRAFDGDGGPNTGGMGCISPAADVGPELVDAIMRTVHRPTINELARLGAPFRGCLYAGLMLTADGPRVLEFNARFGDPETQAIAPRREGDLLDTLLRAATGSLAGADLSAGPAQCVTVVLAARGYPDAPEQGAEIRGIEDARRVEGVTVFHAGTREVEGTLTVAGGRVLNVSALAPDAATARERAYAAVDRISFDGMQVRRDIAATAPAAAGHHV
ncbi:MAG: phosphoribosylamine--glycine ligase [Gaiellales bacterium]